MYSISIFGFTFYLFVGVRTQRTATCLRPVYTLHWCMMTALASGMEQGRSATGDDVVVGIPSSLFITMSCLATLGTIYSLVLIVFNVVYRNDRYETFVSRVLYFLLCNKRLCCRVGRKSEATNSWPQFCQILIDLPKNFTRRFSGKFAVKSLLKIPPRLAYVATLPCETLVSENKRLTINYSVM